MAATPTDCPFAALLAARPLPTPSTPEIDVERLADLVAERLAERERPIRGNGFLSLNDVAAQLRMSRNKVQQAIDEDKLSARRIGRSWLTTQKAVDVFVQGKDDPRQESRA